MKGLDRIKTEMTNEVTIDSDLIIGGALTPTIEPYNIPFYLNEEESEPIFELTKSIAERLNHLFKNTTEAAPVGSLEEYFEAKAARELEEQEAQEASGPNPDLP